MPADLSEIYLCTIQEASCEVCRGGEAGAALFSGIRPARKAGSGWATRQRFGVKFPTRSWPPPAAWATRSAWCANSGEVVLDIGCAAGWTRWWPRTWWAAGRAVGVDVTPKCSSGAGPTGT